MAKYYIGIDIKLRAEAEIEADSLDEAIDKAQRGEYEMPDLNNANVHDSYLMNVLDENYNEMYEF